MQAQLTDIALRGLDSGGNRNHVDVLEENLKRQVHETEALRHDVLLQKLEFEKQTATLNHLIASIHAAQGRDAPAAAAAVAGAAVSPLSDSRGTLSPIKRVPSDGDEPRSPASSLDYDDERSVSRAESDDGDSGSDSDSSSCSGVSRHRQRLLSIVAEVDGEDESLGEQKVNRSSVLLSNSYLTNAAGDFVAAAHTGKRG
jgi:hypothetical protein